jgi:hypothetical protein
MSNLATLVIAAALMATSASGTELDKVERPRALVDISIVDVVTGETSTHKTILIRNGRVSSIPSRRSTSSSARISSARVPFIDGPKDGAPDRITVESPEQAVSAIQALREEQVDFIKIHNGVTREAFLALVGAARAAGLRVATHLPRSLSAEDAVESGVSTLEHTETWLESGLRSLNLTGKSADEGA